MTDSQLIADVGRYALATGGNTVPSAVPSDPLISGATPIEQVLRMLGLAANSGDPDDNAASADEHARRAAMTIAAAEGFTTQDAEAAGDMTEIAPEDQSTAAAAARELPQLLAGIAGAVSGGLSGLLQPLGQIPQQIAQGAQQVMQAGAGLSPAAGAVSDGAFGSIDDASLFDELSAEDLGFAGDDVDSADLPDGAAELGDAAGISKSPGPGIVLAPAATPLAATPSAATLPASAPGSPAPTPAPHIPAAGAGAGMAGMPMIPPGGVTGAGAADRDAKTGTRRIATPPVPNGAPVQGRITAPPPVITTTTDGKPVASRRIVMPSGGQTG